MKKLICLLSLILAFALPICAAAEDAHRWVEDITKLQALPVADESRLDAGFVRGEITNAAEALAAALLWADSDALHLPAAAATDYSAFVMAMNETWHVTLCVGAETAVLQMDSAGRLLNLTQIGSPELPAWEGFLPKDTYTAIRSYIEHFARLNGCEAVTDYARVACAWGGDGYDVRVTVQASLDGCMWWRHWTSAAAATPSLPGRRMRCPVRRSSPSA